MRPGANYPPSGIAEERKGKNMKRTQMMELVAAFSSHIGNFLDYGAEEIHSPLRGNTYEQDYFVRMDNPGAQFCELGRIFDYQLAKKFIAAQANTMPGPKIELS